MAKKLCIVLTSLANGGTERFGATLSFIISSLGYDVYIFTTHNVTEYKYSGQLFSLDAESKKIFGIPGKLLTMYKYFKHHNFDIIIDSRLRALFLKEWMIHKCFYKNSSYIGMVHNHKVSNYFPVNKWWSRFIYKKNNQFVGVSQLITDRVKKVYNFQNIKTIYNPISKAEIIQKSQIKSTTLPFRFILYFGRLERDSKNLSLLIQGYHKSELPKQEISLVIMGKGDDLLNLKALVKTLSLQDYVIFKDYNPNPFPYVKQALFTTLSSRYEGFPMSIIESLACGTPVISVNCKSGPSEVIKNGYNGLLVKNNDANALANAFNTFVNNKTLQATCKSNAQKSVAHLDVKFITQQWQTLLATYD